MPKLTLSVFQYEGPEPGDMLAQALASLFPAGVPAGAQIAAISQLTDDEDAAADEPAEIDDGIEQEEVDEPTATEDEAPPMAPLPPIKPPPRGKIGAQRDAAVAYLRAHGPASRADVGRACGIVKGSIPFAFRHPRFVINAEGLLWLADEPEPAAPAARRSLPLAAPPRRPEPVAVPRAEPPPATGAAAIGVACSPGAVTLCRAALAAELMVAEPQRLGPLIRATKFRDEIVREALADAQFRCTPAGYMLAPARK